MHLGGLRTALYNALFARRHGGSFIVRIEDTDQTRLVPGAAEAIERVLQWAGISPDESPLAGGSVGPYTQSERLGLYTKYADQMLESGAAYRCFCSADRLQMLRQLSLKSSRLTAYDGACRELSSDEVAQRMAAGEESVVRLRAARGGTTTVSDMVYGKVEFANDAIDDQILLKSSGYPTYHMANVVDDHLMGVTHVLRGEEWLSSTAKHLQIYAALNWEPPSFGHIPLLINPDRSKLSKRQGDLRIEALQQAGVLPSALVNFVAFLGWSSPENQSEVYHSLSEIAADFNLEAISRSPTVVDVRKLYFLNKQHQQSLGPNSAGLRSVANALFQKLETRYNEHPGRLEPNVQISQEYLEVCLQACAGTFDTLDAVLECHFFWELPRWTAAEKIRERLTASGDADARRVALVDAFSQLGEADFEMGSAALEQALKAAASAAGCKSGKIQPLLRYCVAAEQSGPPVLRILAALGKERVMGRLVDVPL